MPVQAPVRTLRREVRVVEFQDQLNKLEGHLARLKMQVRQAQQLAGLGTAAMTLMHEANNLLTPMIGYAQAALGSGAPDLMRKALEMALTNGRMLSGLAGRLLEIGAAKPARAAATSILAAVGDARASLGRDLAKDGIRFECDVEPSAHVLIDPYSLRQVFFNLFLNAREAMAGTHHNRLRVRAVPKGSTFEIEVSDTGNGIPQAALGVIFDPLHTSKIGSESGRPRCGGLGLSLCQDLLEEAGGHIRVQSKPSEGTTFTVTLPAAPPPSGNLHREST